MTQSNLIDARQNRIVGYWLFCVAAMVFIMVVIGGLTRLTESGLSMVDWKPLTGWLPPLADGHWQQVFDLYKQSPQYKEINFGMTLAEFKEIFWLEYFHRLWGRLIGLAFGLPLVFFFLRGWISRDMRLPLFLLFLLGGAQGVLGWYMVKSGLIDEPEVSQYRLMAHLGFAFALYGALLWYGFRFVKEKSLNAGARLWLQSRILWGLSFLTILAGALVAGLDAGLTYNTFPLMDGDLVPDGLFMQDPWWINHFENITTVQFQHRLLGITTLCFTLWIWAMNGPYRQTRFCVVVVLLQVVLGIATLLHIVPVSLASLHQAGGLIVFSAITWLNYEIKG